MLVPVAMAVILTGKNNNKSVMYTTSNTSNGKKDCKMEDGIKDTKK